MASNLCIQLDSYRINAESYPSLIREYSFNYANILKETDFDQLKIRILESSLIRQDVKVLAYCLARYDEAKYKIPGDSVPPDFLMMLADLATRWGFPQYKAMSYMTNMFCKTAGEIFDDELQKLLNKYRNDGKETITRADLENLLGISNSTFSKIAKGEMMPTRGLVMAIALFFQLNAAEANDFINECGYSIRNCFPDLYFLHLITEKMYGTRNFVVGVIEKTSEENAKRVAHNRNAKRSDRRALIKLDPFFSMNVKTGQRAYRNLNIDDCKDKTGKVTKEHINRAIKYGLLHNDDMSKVGDEYL